MPVATPQLYQYSHVAETKENLDWADCELYFVYLTSDLCAVPNIDLSKFSSPGGKESLAKQLIEAVRTKGFFYVTGYGISQEDVDRQFALGQAFYELPLEEKLK